MLQFNPKEIKAIELPLIVFADNIGGLIPGIIKAHTKGNYSHVMIQHKVDKFASQDPDGYKEVSIGSYLSNDYRLKYVAVRLNALEKSMVLNQINKELKEGIFTRRYDFLGIIGQFLGGIFRPFKNINNPNVKFCSERVADTFRSFLPIPEHLSPSELNNYFKTQERTVVYGRYNPED